MRDMLLLILTDNKKYLYDGFLLLSKFYYYTLKIAYTHICLSFVSLRINLYQNTKTGYLK